MATTPPQQHPTVVELVGRMEQLGQRRLLQVQGSPDMAMKAMGLVSRTPEQAQGGAQQAKNKAWDWLLDIISPPVSGPSLPEDPGSIQRAVYEVIEIDRAMVRHLHNEGLIPNLPDIWAAGEKQDSHMQSLFGLKKQRIFMKTGVDGLADGISDRFFENKDRTYARWTILMHEIAHTVLDELPPAFCPGGMPVEVASVFNKWITHLGVIGSQPMATAFHECFADAYGTAMFLQTTKNDPDAMRVVQEILAWRTENQKDAEDGYFKFKADPKNKEIVAQGRAALVHPHSTTRALERLVGSHEKLHDMAPQQLLEHCLRVASDGMMDVFDPTRLDENGRPVGREAARVMNETWSLPPKQARLDRAIVGLATLEFAGEDLESYIHDKWSGHPLQPVLMASAPAVKALVEHERLVNGSQAVDQARENNRSLFVNDTTGRMAFFLVGHIRDGMENPDVMPTGISQHLQEPFEKSVQATRLALEKCDQEYAQDIERLNSWVVSRAPEPEPPTSLWSKLSAQRQARKSEAAPAPHKTMQQR